MQTDFTTKMKELQQELETTVKAMNQSTEAAKAGGDTVAAFAEAAAGKVGDTMP